MKTLLSRTATALIAAGAFAGSALAGTAARESSDQNERFEERTVFVTGSLIPQRVKLRRIGTTTVSPVRIIDRQEVDWTGRRTTPGVLIADPSLRIISH